MFDEKYYVNNKQNEKRLALSFYKRVIKRYIKPKVLLDYGCGTGWFLNEINNLKKIKKTYGYEINEYAIEKAKKHSQRSEIIKKLSDIKENSLDCISALHVFEHINDSQLRKILIEFKRILKKKGFIILVMPAKDGFAHQLKGNNWIGYSDNTHINLKNYQGWVNFFKDNNLYVKRSASDGLWNFPYKISNYPIKFFKIFFLMIIQIYFGRLNISYNDGESFIFILQFKN
jgi:SAM-dependent methyltransferase